MTQSRCVLATLLLTLIPASAWGEPGVVDSAIPAPPATRAAGETPLDKYVATPDATYSWTLEGRYNDDDATILIIDLTSQTWRKEGETDRLQWHHWLTITIPKEETSDTALLLVGGGRNGQPAPKGPSERARKAAIATKSIVAELGQVPNQPLIFMGDGKKRSEDDLVARSMLECLKTGDQTWMAQFAMTKAAVRAMDAVQEAVQKYGFPDVRQFVVAGASKRGWTTWLTAVVDPRVAAIAPIVIDVLNVQKSMQNHHAAYGFWAPSLEDYEQQGLTAFVNSPVATVVFGIVDPFTYRQRLALPKCIINATGDQFFTPDSSKLYFDNLPGEKLLCYVPNADHSLDGSDALDTLIAFHASVVEGLRRPQLSWKRRPGGAWEVTSDMAPRRVKMWQAVNETARDFRVETIGKAFTSVDLKPAASGEFVLTPPKVEKGWAAYFGQLEFDIGAPTPLRVTTPVWITPDTLPYADGGEAPNNGAAGGAR
jgi:PhoPQ-activated pathogenicity-related protein